MLFYFEKVDLRINGPFHNCEVWVDNQQGGYVSAYLGDLGRDLPSEREQY